MNKKITSILITSLFTFSFLIPSARAQQQDQKDETMQKLQNLLEKQESPNSSSDSGTDDLEEANRKLHGGENPGERERKKPGEVLEKIIDEMDTAARALETNVQKLRKIKGMLKKLDLNSEEQKNLSEKQKQIVRQLKKLFDDSKQNQKNVSNQLKELISFKDQLASVKSSQKQSISNIEKLLKRSRKKSSSGKKKRRSRKNSGKKKKKKKQARKKQKQKKPARQRKNKNNPADKPYEANSEGPGNVKTHSSGETTRWGNLPDYVRKKVIQRKNEEYVPEYSERLRQYYKKLGERTSE